MERLIFALILFTSLQSFAAGDTALQLQLIKTIPGNYSNFYTDNLQNIYLVAAQNNGVKKLNSNGDSVAVFNNVTRYGRIYLLDVSNPLKILVYYKDFTTVVLLDRFLATRATIDLRKLGITQVKAVALSYDGNIWLYDEGEGKLKKIDENGNVLIASADLRLVFDDALNPEKIIDNSSQLYLYDSQFGWLIFDYYTAFKKRLPFTNWKDVEVNDKKLSGRTDNHFLFATQNDIDYQTMQSNIAVANIQKVKWQSGKLYVLTKDGVHIYQQQR
ncbi:hypothetical protein FC093_16195 [Ilyomonas limi]|uniref:Uncharacterized protein n=1 Tax=Ilyomonas limi TaxID=2575867 RepID=A0A4U3KVH7_9BACT|nr:hypothetical protein [Ilyomonas limi]TKK66585.1 hypothetical protein FC093_16195 [Ilyomonas limi]